MKPGRPIYEANKAVYFLQAIMMVS